jgi:hypothetical protein
LRRRLVLHPRFVLVLFVVHLCREACKSGGGLTPRKPPTPKPQGSRSWDRWYTARRIAGHPPTGRKPRGRFCRSPSGWRDRCLARRRDAPGFGIDGETAL